MQFSFSYDKKKTIQALRYHFISKPDIRIMMILVNVFAIVAAVLFYFRKVRPEPFLLGSCVWIFMMVAIWYILPMTIYKKTSTFKETFIAGINEVGLTFENERGEVHWPWTQFERFIETPYFFHFYFNSKSFILLPKDEIGDEMRHEIRGILNRNIKK
jgi:YcxB-like protein